MSDSGQHEGHVVASTTIRGYSVGGGGESVSESLPWHQGEAYPEQPSTIRSEEIKPHFWVGSYEVKEPGR